MNFLRACFLWSLLTASALVVSTVQVQTQTDAAPDSTSVSLDEAYPDSGALAPGVTEPQFDLGDIQRRAKYPEMARRSRLEDTVVVRVLISESGRPITYRIEHSNHKILEKSAIDAVMGAVFKPGMQDGEPAAVWVSIPVMFRLH